MTKAEKLEHEVQELSREELSFFRDWFSKYDSDEWDRQIEKDIRADRLESLAEETIADHKDGFKMDGLYHAVLRNFIRFTLRCALHRPGLYSPATYN